MLDIFLWLWYNVNDFLGKRFQSDKEAGKIANIKDVAKMANVSVATVSRVLNKTRHVSEEIEKAVLEAARELGYTPNLLGKNLRQKCTGIILVMMSTLTNSFCSKVVTGIANEAEKHNYHIMICATNGLPEKEKIYLGLVKNRMADGMIVLNSTLSADEMSLISNHAAIVQCSEYTASENTPFVSIDNGLAAKDACEHLILNGRKRILFIGVDNSLISSHLRMEGYRQALSCHGLPFDPGLVLYSNYGYRNTMRVVDRYLEEGHTFDAVFAISDRMAAGAVSALRKHGLTVPENIEVIGFDNTDIAYMVEPPLTTVSQPQTEMGKRAFSILYDKLNGGEPENVILPHKLIVRKSAK